MNLSDNQLEADYHAGTITVEQYQSARKNTIYWKIKLEASGKCT